MIDISPQPQVLSRQEKLRWTGGYQSSLPAGCLPEDLRLKTDDDPMKIAYLECFSGMSGDMFLGALVDAGVSAGLLEQTVAALDIGARLEISRVNRSGITATKVDVFVRGERELPREEFLAASEKEHDHSHEHGDSHGHSHGEAHAYPHSHSQPWSRTGVSAPHSHEHSHSQEHWHGHGLKEIREIIRK